jgi:diaminopimelate epimerase
MKISFSKYQGTGNDFVMVDNRAHTFPEGDQELVKKLCDRRFGIGADGLILLDRKADDGLRMTYFNSDGNLSSMCGNGGRCFAAFARRCGITGDEITFEAADGSHRALFTSDSPVTVEMTMGDVTSVETGPDFQFLDTGSPHVVKFVSEVGRIDVKNEGKSIRNSARFKAEGTNVNFVEVAPRLPYSTHLRTRSGG